MADSRLARLLGCTDGQVWTLGITVGVVAALLPATLPAGLRPQGDVVIQTAAPAPNQPPAILAPEATPVPPSGVLPPIPLPQPQPQLAPQPQPQPQPAPTRVPEQQTSAPPAEQPLQIVQAGWYDPDPEGPARQQLTPPGELPVSADRGARAASSVLRLSGNASTLVLVRDGTPAAGTPVLQLCRNASASWTGFDNMPFGQAPAVTTSCARGTPTGDHWAFALDDLGAPDATTGFTLRAVVSGAPTETFSITFLREPAS